MNVVIGGIANVQATNIFQYSGNQYLTILTTNLPNKNVLASVLTKSQKEEHKVRSHGIINYLVKAVCKAIFVLSKPNSDAYKAYHQSNTNEWVQ